MTARASPSTAIRRLGADRLVLLGLLGLAAILRLPNLGARGSFDADQGRIMLALQAWLREGTIPLLGQPASIGGVHHGVLSYYLLAPGVVIGGLDPTAAVAVVTLAGIASVGFVWFLARAIGGPAAGLIAGFLFAISATEVGRSTSLWNPNVVPLGAALAATAAWQAWSRRQPAWWLVAGPGAAIALHGHLLSGVVLGPLAALAIADLARRRGAERRVALALLGAAAIIAASYVPLLLHELQSDFAETRAFLALATEGTGARPSIWTVVVVALRVGSWSLVGLVTRAPELAVAVTAGLALGLAWLAAGGGRASAARFQRGERSGGGQAHGGGGPGAEGRPGAAVPESDQPDPRTARPQGSPVETGTTPLPGSAGAPDRPPEPDWTLRRTAVRWLAAVLVVTVLALALVAPSLATVVEALPVDQYHAAADPIVVALAGVVLGALWTDARRTTGGARRGLVARFGEATVLAVIAGLGLWNLATQPPPVAPDGGWPAVKAAAVRIDAALSADRSILLRSLPTFTAPDAYTFALRAVGRTALGPETPSTSEPPPARGPVALVVVCDDRFRLVTGAGCAGPAEGRWLAGTSWRLRDRFVAAPERVLSVYVPEAGVAAQSTARPSVGWEPRAARLRWSSLSGDGGGRFAARSV